MTRKVTNGNGETIGELQPSRWLKLLGWAGAGAVLTVILLLVKLLVTYGGDRQILSDLKENHVTRSQIQADMKAAVDEGIAPLVDRLNKHEQATAEYQKNADRERALCEARDHNLNGRVSRLEGIQENGGTKP